MRLFALALGALTLAACSGAHPMMPVVTDAASLVTAMHVRYDGRWYRTIRFDQATTRLNSGGEPETEMWREWGAFPGRLRIEMGDPAEGRGALYARDSLFSFRADTLAASMPLHNELLVLGFDVYHQSPAVTLARIVETGVDTSAFREDTWQERRAYVIGEGAEVWIDAERLVFVRLLKPAPNGAVQDIRFDDYERLGDAWIAPTVEVWVDGRKVFWEAYENVRAGVEIDPALFDPARWAETAPAPD